MGLAGGLGPTAVETATAVAESQQTTVQTAQTQRSNVNRGQQGNTISQRVAQTAYRDLIRHPGSGLAFFNDCGLSPHVYGLYLLRTGKNKYNDRKRKHYAKRA